MMRQMVKYTYATIRNKAENKSAKTSGGRCEAQKNHVIWLGLRAMHAVLSRKAHLYPQILKGLEFDLGRPQYRNYRRLFQKVTKEGLELIVVLSF